MADAKRCDRCGKYYSRNDDNDRCHLSCYDLRYYEKFDIDYEYIVPVTVTFSETGVRYYKFELCPDCMRELINAITTKEESNDNNT